MPDLTRDEAREELERIARESKNDSARISAIRQLREMWAEDERADGEQPAAEGTFGELYELPRRDASAA